MGKDFSARRETGETVISLPFTGLWLARNSPARRVPSHGTDLLGTRYAIDFVGTDERRRAAPVRDWRTLLATEAPDRYYAFGQPLLAPADGVVVDVHDGEADHAGRRSPLALVPYMLGQAQRLRAGPGAVAGNYVTIALPGNRAFVALAHLRSQTIRPAIGDTVRSGEQIAECGNSGNSTQPHVHIQIMDSPDISVARGLPMAFSDFRERRRGSAHFEDRAGVPGEESMVQPLAG
ncbi:M23 family metallopeptidase [Salinispora vitiensis]|uniref:M23 family metallopeptidase n=1 Tax=Salinispora vitiensis TaxID=999544 RepID=UPI000373530A|nr:M23 family metallopeptidase [Salinispora vitiensis]